MYRMQFMAGLTKTYAILKHNYNLLAFAFGCLGIGLGIAVSKLPGTVLQVSGFFIKKYQSSRISYYFQRFGIFISTLYISSCFT